MIELGKYNELKVVKSVEFGLYLDGDDYGEILIPTRYIPINTSVDDVIRVFLYRDSEDRIIATTEKPLAIVGECAYLKVVSKGKAGVFVDWGLTKDILVPYSEQGVSMEPDNSYLVYIYVDQQTDRIVASSKLDKFIDNTFPEYEEKEEVDIIIHSKTDLGYKAVINNLHWGVLYQNEVFQSLKQGQKLKAYIKKVREDDKIDLSLHKPGYDKVEDSSRLILDALRENKGKLNLTDKSPADEIYAAFRMSKKTFKKAIGKLYKEKIIALTDDGISLN
ncbi:MAG: GntR family transcriptional regulator [Bacteroidales bacterium]|nr:GntR family transcriptional regulator [Bacteroidales bacterium]MBN2819053.1 GntR family transcriptional regulator [Bacteroidales bacterium]